MAEKILVRATNWVGDLVMATPALAAIRKSFPDAKISVLVRPPLGELLEHNPAVDELIHYDKRREHSGPAGIAKIAGELKKRKFDRAILLQNAFEAALIAFLAKIPVRMGYATDGRKFLLTDSVSVAPQTREKHQVHYYLDMLASLGLKTASPDPRLYVSPEETKEAKRTFIERGIKPDALVVGINPGAQYGVAKRWHPERFGAVADRLANEFGAGVVIFGGPAERGTAGAVEASMKTTAVNLAGQTSIRQLMALIKRCGLFITNDTGPMHIAAALGVPTLAVFGSTDHIATGPYGPSGRVVRRAVTCSPCLKRTCPQKHYRCIERVSPSVVFEAAAEMIRGVPDKKTGEEQEARVG